VSEVAPVLHGISAPEDRWEDSSTAGLGVLGSLAYRSNLLGADRAIANQGGGNTSAKETMADHLGRDGRVLWVKGSGTDLATIAPAGFAGLRLDELLPLRARDGMDDAEMVDYLRRCAVSPDGPRPSIETLLHAFIAVDHVDHTHPDAVIALTSAPDGRRLAEETFGEEVVWLDYQRPGFDMSRRIALLLDAQPTARAVLLERHGLVTWGDTSEDSYRATLEFVARAVEAISRAAGGRFGLGGSKVAELREESAVALLTRSLPSLRGALLADADGVILEVDRSAEAVAFASSKRAGQVSQIGAPCPDHLIHTKHKPLAVESDPETGGADQLSEAFKRGVEEYSRWYRDYYERNVDDETRPFPVDPAGPRVVLVPGVGIVTAGSDAGRARQTRDLYHRAIAVQDAADALGGFRSLSESEAFAIEYWPLERYKLAQAPAHGELSGRVAVITGGASGIGRATARTLAARGAHVVVADLNVEGAQAVADELVSSHGLRRALAVSVDVTREEAVEEMTRRAVLEYGGIDILVASAGLASSSPITETTLEDWEHTFAVLARGYFLAAREAFSVLIEQGCGGSVVFVASKNALVAGANAAAYSSAKAASLHLARCLAEEGGPHGIRVNTVNPDAVIEGSGIWSSDWKAERASTYGVPADDLPGFYRGRTKLGVNVYPEDVAEAIAFLAGPRSAKSTGNVINVDGGVSAAYPR
jgi:rhamnulose-1-phosphate aldolase/alcohol dehydrogenase